jgi:hypothetical protein
VFLAMTILYSDKPFPASWLQEMYAITLMVSFFFVITSLVVFGRILSVALKSVSITLGGDTSSYAGVILRKVTFLSLSSTAILSLSLVISTLNVAFRLNEQPEWFFFGQCVERSLELAIAAGRGKPPPEISEAAARKASKTETRPCQGRPHRRSANSLEFIR